MARLGVHFVLTDEQLKRLLSFENDEDRLNYVKEDIEEAWDAENLHEIDKAWYALHRCFTGPQAYAWPDVDDEAGSYPLNLCFFGGKSLYGQPEYGINLIEPGPLHDLVQALEPLDREWFDKAFRENCQGCWPADDDDAREYFWENFVSLKEFFGRTDGKGQSLIFTVDF
ncbi:MAG: YfbM family protein [Dongiaceae bacterium]